MKNLTIVGPAADSNDKLDRRSKVNIEALFLMAKYDEAFRGQLLNERSSALDASGIQFTQSERRLLERTSNETLEHTIARYAMPGIEKESLPNWRAAATVIMLVTSVMFGSISCQRNISTRPDLPPREGWINNDTFRVIAVGCPKKGITNKAQRMGTARENAILVAQYMIMEKFVGSRIEGAGGMVDYDSDYTDKRKYTKVAKAGKIISESFDAEDNCEIIFEVQDKDLKKTVTGYGVD